MVSEQTRAVIEVNQPNNNNATTEVQVNNKNTTTGVQVNNNNTFTGIQVKNNNSTTKRFVLALNLFKSAFKQAVDHFHRIPSSTQFSYQETQKQNSSINNSIAEKKDKFKKQSIRLVKQKSSIKCKLSKLPSTTFF